MDYIPGITKEFFTNDRCLDGYLGNNVPDNVGSIANHFTNDISLPRRATHSPYLAIPN